MYFIYKEIHSFVHILHIYKRTIVFALFIIIYYYLFAKYYILSKNFYSFFKYAKMNQYVDKFLEKNSIRKKRKRNKI